MGAGISSQVTDGLGWPTRTRGKVVSARLETFVAPAVEDEPKDLSYVDWVQFHNNKVRENLRGSANLTQRLNGDADENEQERPPERVLKGEAFMVKMLEQRLRRKAQA
jgi:hypothetical protein